MQAGSFCYKINSSHRIIHVSPRVAAIIAMINSHRNQTDFSIGGWITALLLIALPFLDGVLFYWRKNAMKASCLILILEHDFISAANIGTSVAGNG